MANPIQQGLKPISTSDSVYAGGPQWLIQYNKD